MLLRQAEQKRRMRREMRHTDEVRLGEIVNGRGEQIIEAGSFYTE